MDLIHIDDDVSIEISYAETEATAESDLICNADADAHENDSGSDNDLLISTFSVSTTHAPENEDTVNETSSKEIEATEAELPTNSISNTDVNDNESNITTIPSSSMTCTPEIYAIVNETVMHCNANGFHNNPVDILRSYQSRIVTGRNLEIEDDSILTEGATSQIFVDRRNILKTGLDEIKAIEDKRVTIEVQFYNEVHERYNCTVETSC